MDLSAAAGLFVALHGLAAAASRNPEIAMSQEDGDRAVQAWSNVARHYDIRTTQKTFDWIAAGGITLTLYLPRFYAIRARHQQEAMMRRAQTTQRPPGTVYPFAVPNVEPTIQ